ncbi:MAG: NADPH-dependent glutamate synthase [Clostridiales bacterium]|nr:NADPH-dependent glutamate synthase [Clostridiales bacterium]
MFLIKTKRELNPTVTLMEIEAPAVAKKAEPGQFIILRVDADGERIPLTVADFDREAGTVTIIFQIVGATTEKLNAKKQGEYIEDFVGPLGVASHVEGLKKVAVVGGGVGCAIAYPIAKKLHNMGAEVHAIVGFRNKDLVILEEEFKNASSKLVMMTDDGSYGTKGLVTNALEELIQSGEQYDEVIAIGPLIMMKFVCLLTKKYNIKTMVSMNPIMIDGTGMCGGCRLTVGGQTKFASQGRAQLMPNMSLKKNEMPVQDAKERSANFNEVALGYTLEQALDEANRCLNCKNKPCVGACPVNINIPAFIEEIRKGDLEQAYQIISKSSSLPAVCGRVCPQETQCEGKCVRGIKGEPVGIGRLERFVADYHNAHAAASSERPEPNGHRVAVIGAGPAGLTCAGDLAKKGYAVTIFEALHVAGGVLVYGIPEFRLPKDIVRREIENLKNLGVEINTNMVIGKVISIDELFEQGFESVFIGTGAGLPRFMNIPGENYNGVYSANEFLTRVNLMKAYRDGSDTPIKHSRNVAVVGGGNVAMDAARCAKRLGAENVYIVYRRGLEEMPARHEEVEHAMEEGIIFKVLNNPVEILGDENNFVRGMDCVEMELGEPDASGRRRPVEKPDSRYTLEVDCVIMAIGTSPNPLIRSTTKGLETNKHGCIVTQDESGLTTRENVYAGGDAVTGAATVILAMGAGKHAAAAIDEALSKN